MNLTTVTLRREAPADFREVENLIREAFWNHYAPGCDEHYLAHVLRAKPAFVPELDILAEADGRIVGHILYTRAEILTDAGAALPVLSFGPIAVLPACQGQGVGGKLIHHTLNMAREMGERAVCIYGDPTYYSRYGFVPAENYGIGTAGNEYMPSLQAVELFEGALKGAAGRFVEDETFSVDEEAAKAFDLTFPPKTRESGTPSQQQFLAQIAQRRPRA
jgi:predicted N-acetyltransferase YhbS